MTLFGVGLKVEAKAADSYYWQYEKYDDNTGEYVKSATQSWKDADRKALYYKVYDFPTTDAEDPFVYEFEEDSIFTDISGGVSAGPSIEVGEIDVYKDKTVYVDSSSVDYKNPILLFYVEKADLLTYFENEGPESKGSGGAVSYAVKWAKGTANFESSDDFAGYKIIPEPTLNGTVGSPNVTFNVPSVILLEGEEFDFTATEVSAGFKYVDWTSNCSISKASKTGCTVTANGLPGETSGLYINYITNPSMTLTFTKKLDGAVLAKKAPIDSRIYEFKGGYKGSDIDKIEINGVEVESLQIYPKTEKGQISFKIPNSIPSNPNVPAEIVVKMKDKNEFKGISVYVIDPDDVVVTLAPSEDQEIAVGKSEKFTASLTPKIEGATFTFSPSSKNKYISVKPSGATATVAGITETETPVYLQATASFKIEGSGADKSTKDSNAVGITVVSPTLELESTVFVNDGLSIKLSKYTGNGSVLITKVTTTSDAKISVSSINKNGTKASEVTITGNSGKSDTQKASNGITVESGEESATADVVVYPKPSVSVTNTEDSAKSGTSGYTITTHKFTVTMPKGDYHDDITEASLKKAEIVLKNSSGDEKSLGFKDLDSSDGKLNISITDKELAEYFGETTTGKTVTFYAYAAYKDGSDYKRDDKVYVTKEITYKYSSGSSGSPADKNSDSEGGNPDDPDPVPKTGESKADIWILWSVLLISILGAGFMIYKRFGLVRAIAEADEEVAIAEHRERVEAEKKEEENKMNMLKSLRNLK